MALCSSTYNPLNQITKHIQGDRGLQRDRLVYGNRRKGQTFRSARHDSHPQINPEFEQFNRSNLPLSELADELQGLSNVPGGVRHHEFQQSQAATARGWLSEYHNGISWPVEEALEQSQSSHAGPQTTMGNQKLTANKHSNFGVPTRYADALLRQQDVPSAGLANANMLTIGSTGGRVNYLPSFPHEQLSSLDWEHMFASLETETKVSPALADSLPNCGILSASDCSKQRRNFRALETVTTDYRFQDENPFCDNVDPFEKGMEIINGDGNLSLAALAFEAACQQDQSNFEAWRMLGSVLSEIEREETAIEALQEALKLDPDNLDIVMRLSISYTNDGSVSLAHEYLEKWLRLKYPDIPFPELEPDNYFPTASQSLERIQGPYIEAARLSVAEDNTFDPDVQVGLGVLLFSARQYQLAADCFLSAIQSNSPGTTNSASQLHLLWNRYGACLGNMNLYDEAVEAYEMALAIKPNCVRARYNLGLLYYNKNEPVLAARSTIEALIACNIVESKTKSELLKIVKVGTSHGRLEQWVDQHEPTALYETLRKCCGSIFRWDLLERVGPEMDLRMFQMVFEGL
ncbi:hypothetical protein B0O99DRAFT_684073 [Bisporella sp. PMI_857]|nr:hypothetical protein B0O99DRAFT_684073 [Bisporella sp. PMI_857]